MRANVKSILSLKNTFYIGLFASVFVFWPWSDILYEIPKVWFVQRWIEILAIITIFRLKFLKKEKLDNPIIIFEIIILFSAILSSVLGTDIAKSIAGNYYRGDGLVTLIHLVLLFFTILLFSKKSWIGGFVKIISLSAIVLASTSILQLISNFFELISFGTWEGGYGNFFGNPNFLAGYLIVALPATAYLIDASTKKVSTIFKFGLLLQIIGILLTKAWDGYFGILIFMFCWLWFKFKNFRWPLFLLGGVSLAILAFNFWQLQKPLQAPISTNPESRQRILMKGLLAFEKKPVLGWGWSNFDKAFESVDYPFHFYNDVYVDKAHSSLLEVLTTTGVVGFAIYSLLMARIIVNLYKSKSVLNKYILFSFILLILHMQTNVISISEEIIFWIIAGFSAKIKYG